MNNIKKNYQSVFKILIGLLPVIVAVILAVCAPFMQDDWAWGTSVGAVRFQSFFANYNGRYLGNLFVYVVTRSQLIWIVSMPVSVILLAVAMQRITGCKRLAVYLAAPSILLLMRTQMFRQIIVWRSGFSNYFPPILCAVVYIAIISNVFGDKCPHYKKHITAITFIVGICGALFMEHVTMYSVLLGIAVILYSKMRFGKIYSPYVSYLIGAVMGAVFMFSNSAYINILLGRDDNNYRTMGGQSLSYTIMHNSRIISRWFIEYNPALITIIFVLFAVLTVYYQKKKQLNKNKIAVLSVAMEFDICYITLQWVLYATKGKALTGQKYDLLRLILAVLTYASFVLITFVLPIGRVKRDKLVFSFLSAGAICVPLFIITPVSPRCLFPSYVMMTLAICILTSSVISKLGKKMSIAVPIVMMLLFVFGSFYYCSAYINVYNYESQRRDYVTAQIESGTKSIDVPIYPNDMKRFASADYRQGTVWTNRFAEYYGVNQNDKNVSISQSPPLDLPYRL